MTTGSPQHTAPFLLAFGEHQPQLAGGAWAAPGSTLIGRVSLGADSNVWYGAVLRGDAADITVGARTNIQDGCVVHADPGFPAAIGADVTVGHRAVVHGCTVEDDTLIGMGAVVLNGAKVGRGSLVAAGAVVLEGAEIPPGSLVAGTPGKVRRELTSEEQQMIQASAKHYVELAAAHRLALTS